MGTTSDKPVDVSVVNDRNNSSNQVRGASGSWYAVNDIGQTIWTAL